MGKARKKTKKSVKKSKKSAPKHNKEKQNNKLGIALLIIAGVMIIATFIYTNTIKDSVPETSSGSASQTEKSGTETMLNTLPPAITDDGRVVVEFYVMSQCPYGTQVEDAIAPVLETIGDKIDFRLDFIVSDQGNGNFQSLHGQPEVQGNIVQLCAKKYEPDRYMEMITCMNQNAGAIPNNWQQCAAGLDAESIKECYEGEEGKQLLSQSAARSALRQAQGSPTIYIGGESYSGPRDAGSFTAAICNHLPDDPVCQALPDCYSDADCAAEPTMIGKCENPGSAEAKCTYTEDALVEVIVVNDETCNTCDPAQLIQATNYYFKNTNVKYVDVSSDTGQEIIEKYGLTKAPSILFSDSVEDTYMYEANPQLKTAFEKIDDAYKLKDESTGATHWIDQEAYGEFKESIGVEIGDNRPQIDFYVMSYCPYGNQAEEAIEPVYQLLKEHADFNPKYVWYSNYQGGGPNYCLDDESLYCSMHGIGEARQNIRELCVKENYGTDAWFEFALEMNKKCTSSNADTCYVSIADDLGYDTDVIESCVTDNALEYAEPDYTSGNNLGVRGSPSVFIDGEAYSGGRTPEGYKQALCQAFEDAPEECDDVLDSSGEEVSGGCGA